MPGYTLFEMRNDHAMLVQNVSHPDAWAWNTPMQVHPDDQHNNEIMAKAGWEKVGSYREAATEGILSLLCGQLSEICLLSAPDATGTDTELWASSVDIERVARIPVVLAFTLSPVQERRAKDRPFIETRQAIPPVNFGEIALVNTKDERWTRYKIAKLPSESQQRQQQIHAALLALDLAKDGITWMKQWREIQAMARQLASDYWTYALEQEPRLAALPALEDNHRTRLPSNNGFRALAPLFGLASKDLKWETPGDTDPYLQIGPDTRSILTHGPGWDGIDDFLTHITAELGPESHKYMTAIFAAYDQQTGGIDQKMDAHIKLRQILTWMGKEQHADDKDEQRKLLAVIYFAAHTYVTAREPVPFDVLRERGKGAAQEEEKSYSPVLIIEKASIKLGPDGKLVIPSSIDFHLGDDYFQHLYGPRPHYFSLPTSAFFQYHGRKQAVELCLVRYLADKLTLDKGKPSRLYFYTLCEKAGLLVPQQTKQGHNRMREATAILYALERIEQDNWVIRQGHTELDTVLAIDLITGKITNKHISEATFSRLHRRGKDGKSLYSRCEHDADIVSLRRQAIQRLLQRSSARALEFEAGGLLEAEIIKAAEGRDKAMEHQEASLEAHVIKKATPKVVEQAKEALNKKSQKIPPLSEENTPPQ